MKIIFVCTGNTCRSPMAEGFMKHLIHGDDFDLCVESRGLMAETGTKAHAHAITVMRQNGIDIHTHRAKTLSPEDLDETTLILTMTHHHVSYIQEHFEGLAHQVTTLSEFADQTGDVLDPYGMPIGAYEACGKVLKDLTQAIYQRIKIN